MLVIVPKGTQPHSSSIKENMGGRVQITLEYRLFGVQQLIMSSVLQFLAKFSNSRSRIRLPSLVGNIGDVAYITYIISLEQRLHIAP